MNLFGNHLLGLRRDESYIQHNRDEVNTIKKKKESTGEDDFEMNMQLEAEM